jgi:hypothetical protein
MGEPVDWWRKEESAPKEMQLQAASVQTTALRLGWRDKSDSHCYMCGDQDTCELRLCWSSRLVIRSLLTGERDWLGRSFLSNHEPNSQTGEWLVFT